MKVVEQPALLRQPLDFSPVLGGPLYQLWRRAHLSGDTLELLYRRIATLAIVTWLPLLILTAVGGQAIGTTLKVPFVRDIETHVRFLVALPLLIVAELLVHKRTYSVMRRFVERRIVTVQDFPAYEAAIEGAVRVRNSVSLEVMLLILVWSVGNWVWRSQVALASPTWYFVPDGQRWHLTLAGYWFAFVSLPVFQFLLIRWYVRIAVWFMLLWRVSRLNLCLTATHPDRAGGIGFVGKTSHAFGPLLVAQGALLSGMIANRVLYEGQNLLTFKMEAAALVAFFVCVVLGPLVMFTPQMFRARQQALGEYGTLATDYVRGFEDKWIRAKAARTDDLLGTGDIQSLADLGNSYGLVRDMRVVPFGGDDIIHLALATVAPLVPLGLTVLSLEDLIKKLIEILF